MLCGLMDGKIVVAVVHGDRTLKRLRSREGRHWLVEEADGYPDIIVDEHVETWGVVFAWRGGMGERAHRPD